MSGPHYLYRCYDADGLLLYIGCTGNPRRRMEHHRAGRRTQASKLLALFMDRCEIDGDPHLDRDAALRAEWSAIHAEQPLFNTQGRGKPMWLIRFDLREYLRDHGVDHVGLLPPSPELDSLIDERFAAEVDA